MSLNMSEIVTPVYKTHDFEFIVAAMAFANPRLKVVHFEPYATEENERAGRRRRIVMHLAGVDARGNTYDACDAIEELRLKYANSELLVDPRDVFSQQRNIRAMIADVVVGKTKSESAEELVGTEFSVLLMKLGRKEGQAIGYLPDDTVVVVEKGAPLVGQKVCIVIRSVFKTESGRMTFADLLIDESEISNE